MTKLKLFKFILKEKLQFGFVSARMLPESLTLLVDNAWRKFWSTDQAFSHVEVVKLKLGEFFIVKARSLNI